MASRAEVQKPTGPGGHRLLFSGSFPSGVSRGYAAPFALRLFTVLNRNLYLNVRILLPFRADGSLGKEKPRTAKRAIA